MIILSYHTWDMMEQVKNYNILGGKKINLMADKKYVQRTLQMPSELPLFNYNIDFSNLRTLLEEVNIGTNNNSQAIRANQQQIATKLPQQQFVELEKVLDESLRFGLHTQKWVDESQSSSEKVQRKDVHMMGLLERYEWKMGRMMAVLEQLVCQTNQNTHKLNQANRDHENHINNSFRRIDQRVEATLQAQNKNINMYFTNTDKKVSELNTQHNNFKVQTHNNFDDLRRQLTQRITQHHFSNTIKSIDQRVKASLEEELKNDHMKRLATVNQFSTKLKNYMNDTDLKQKHMKETLKSMAEKVSKCFTTGNFQIEKHKIFDKLSQFKSRLEQSLRKGNQFIEYRKSALEVNERTKQDILGLEDQIKKMKEKGSSFKKMEDIGSTLEALDPHLICQMGSQVKLHEKQIGKLEKQVIYFQKELESIRSQRSRMPEVNSGQSSEMVTKLIKDYMANMDFQGRVKRTEKDIHDLSRRSQGVNDLEKKLFMLSKDLDMGQIMREIRKKSDDETTRRDMRIIDSKIEKLFQFYKSLRRNVDEAHKNSGRGRQLLESASLTTKKLYSPNCLSCTPKHRPRTYSKKIDMSLDEPLQQLKGTLYSKNI